MPQNAGGGTVLILARAAHPRRHPPRGSGRRRRAARRLHAPHRDVEQGGRGVSIEASVPSLSLEGLSMAPERNGGNEWRGHGNDAALCQCERKQ